MTKPLSNGVQPAKTPKTSGPKLKLTTPKTPAEASSKKKTPKSKASARKSAAKTTESDDEMNEAPNIVEKPLTPAEAKEKKEKESKKTSRTESDQKLMMPVRYYRHKLQKGFLSRDTVPADDEIKVCRSACSTLADVPSLCLVSSQS